MRRLYFLTLVLLSCATRNGISDCPNGKVAQYGISYNKVRIKYGAPILHSYLCLESVTAKMESWEAPLTYQLRAKNGYHAGKGVFLQSDLDLDEKDIFRNKLNDSTYEMLGILTEVKAGIVTHPGIWYDTVDVSVLKNDISRRRFETGKEYLSLEQADSILASWGTSRR